MRQPITLTDQEHQYLQMFVHRGKANARTLTRARVLLKVAEGRNDQEVVAAFDICQSTMRDACHSMPDGLPGRKAGGASCGCTASCSRRTRQARTGRL